MSVGDGERDARASAVPAVDASFDDLVAEWKRETLLESSMTNRMLHRAHQRIIGMGPAAVPLILAELEREPDYWFWALTAITGEDPAEGTTSLNAARRRWLEWRDGSLTTRARSALSGPGSGCV